MSDVRENLHNIFKKSIILTETEIKKIGEGFWDDVTGELSKAKDVVKNPVKSLISKVSKPKEIKKKRVPGTGVTNTVSTTPKPVVSPNVANVTPAPKQSNPLQTILPSNKPVDKKPEVSPTQTAGVALPNVPIKKNDNADAMIIDPKSGRNLVHPDKPIVILNPIGIELQNGEDANQKEKKIINPLRNLLKIKNREFTNAFNRIKSKNGITSKNSVEEISTKDPSDTTRKVIIRNLFAIKFYKDSYENLLYNLRTLNIISENKLDYGTFQQATLNALEKAKEQHLRRYAANIKKINSLDRNENDVKLGLRKGEAAFKKDINTIYKDNKDNFTMRKMEESNKFYDYFFEEFVEATPTQNAQPPEDNSIKINDYVWWVDTDQIEKVLTDDNQRKQLKYENNPIEFVDTGNGSFLNGTSATVKFLSGPKSGESEKIDIRNLDVPQNIAKNIISFGKVIGDSSKQKELNDIETQIKDAEDQLKTPGITGKDSSEINADLEKLKKSKNDIINKGSFTSAKVQKFIPKDINSIDKTLAGGKTKITPDPSNKVVDVDVKNLVKLNQAGKSKLVSVIGKTVITLGVILGLVSGSYLSTILTKVNDLLSHFSKNIGDMAGSKTSTNF